MGTLLRYQQMTFLGDNCMIVIKPLLDFIKKTLYDNFSVPMAEFGFNLSGIRPTARNYNAPSMCTRDNKEKQTTVFNK
jgi:hypothetical protein